MSWTTEHDVLLCREILVEEPYKFKHGSRDRGKKWEKIAQNLNAVDRLYFSVDQRAVRDRFMKIERAFKRKIAKEGRTPTGNPFPTEIDQLMEDITEFSEAAHEKLAMEEERLQSGKREKVSTEPAKRKAVEKLVVATRGEGLEPVSKMQRTREDEQNLVQYLREKNEVELKVRMDEYELKKRELTFREKEIAQQWEIRKRDQELKEKEYEVREKRERQTLELLQQQIRLQQQQSQLLLDFMMKLMEKNV